VLPRDRRLALRLSARSHVPSAVAELD
jgi:hypothetical protein